MARSVLITGSSSGFGLETAALLATRGWRVFATMRDPALGERLAAAGATAEVLRLDVADATSVTDAVREALDRAGALDAAVEVAPFGIGVALVEPGTYRTGIWTAASIARRPGSPYGRYVDAMEPRVRESVRRFGRDPREVAERIARVLDARRPALRHPVGPDAHLTRVLAHALPFAVRRRLVSRMTGLRG